MVIILLYFFFFKSFKKSFPIIISILFVLNEIGLPFSLISTEKITYLLTLMLLFKSFRLLKKIEINYLIKISIILTVIYILYILSFYYNNSFPDYRVFFRKTDPLIWQFYIFIGLVYFKRYGTNTFYKYIYIAMVLHLIFWTGYVFIIPFRDYGIIGLEAYHSATVGFTAAYIIGYNLLVKRKPTKAIVFIVSLLPFLGMARGGIIAVTIAFVGYYIYKGHIKSLIYGLLSIALIIYVSNYLIVNVIPQDFVFSHQGAHNLTELFAKSESAEIAIPTRLIRWQFLIYHFLINPIFGAGLLLKTTNAGLDIDAFVDLWQGHNYFLSMLAAGGLFLSLPIIILTIISIAKSFKWFISSGKNLNNIFGAILVLNVININFTNTYFASYWAGPMIWSLFAVGLYELTNKKSEANTESSNN